MFKLGGSRTSYLRPNSCGCGGDMLNGSLFDDTLSRLGAGVVLGGLLLDTVGSLSLPTSLPLNTGLLELVDIPAQALQ
ncbi:hypothetical protein [Zhongshania sp.]|uniref:hypothetical protein n=1 Tax=Zhongshania sp. TaxID=1971902 RepID=UPI003565221B